MLTAHALEGHALAPGADPAAALWIDLMDPTPAEIATAEAALGASLPSRETRAEIEASSRLYLEGGAAFMTALMLEGAEEADPRIAPVTFALTADRLATVRDHDPRPFRSFAARADRNAAGCENADGLLLTLLEAAVDRLADVLEETGRDIEALSREVFRAEDDRPISSNALRRVIRKVGGADGLLSKLRDSLQSLDRLCGFLAQVQIARRADKTLRARLKTLSRDLRSLIDQTGFLNQKTAFLLDATVGLIGVEQTYVVKIFSVIAGAFLPPTLIASIYGMNFAVMPELEWVFGYPFALALMLASAVLPLFYFRRRGWL